MSSMIGGTDLIFEAPWETFRPRLILDVLLDWWPEGLFQNANEETTQSLSLIVAGQSDMDASEFFVYRDEASARSWNSDGRTDANANDMLHFLVVSQGKAKPIQITLVCEALTPEVANLYNDLFIHLSKRVRLLDFDAELRAAGCRLTRTEFYDLIEEVWRALYPEWTQEDLACHPLDALQFCEILRRKAEAPLPDSIILRALLNCRKRARNYGKQAIR